MGRPGRVSGVGGTWDCKDILLEIGEEEWDENLLEGTMGGE